MITQRLNSRTGLNRLDLTKVYPVLLLNLLFSCDYYRTRSTRAPRGGGFAVRTRFAHVRPRRTFDTVSAPAIRLGERGGGGR